MIAPAKRRPDAVEIKTSKPANRSRIRDGGDDAQAGMIAGGARSRLSGAGHSEKTAFSAPAASSNPPAIDRPAP